MLDLSWRDLPSILIAAGLAGGMVMAWIRWQLSGDFVRAADITGLSGRIEQVERRLSAMPAHADLEALNVRIGRVERNVDVVAADLRGVREGVGRIERDLHLLIRHHIGEAS